MNKRSLLIKESSLYLLSHADNPVNWYPWGAEAFKRADEEDRVVIVSIGYSSCHWCHVMAHQSFEDKEVAEIMNSKFISVKVDREERPDVDKLYMDAAVYSSGHGGWPLNVFTLPDGRPFFGGTYFRKEDWISVLKEINKIWTKDRDKIYEQAIEITKAISKDPIPLISKAEKEIKEEDIKGIVNNLINSLDPQNGGLKGQMKFPFPSIWDFLLEYNSLYREDNSEFHLLKSLDKMSAGGIYDHVGGGFARYSVDPQWFAPHFEKMLYDNGLLTSLYAKAYTYSKDTYYRKVAEKTATFLMENFLSPEGGFYSSLDADSEGEEGLYYTWTYEELLKGLGENSEAFFRYFNITPEGNWEKGRNILYPKDRSQDLTDDILKKLEVLKGLRKNRVAPTLDKKVIASWNGMALTAFTNLYKATKKEKYLEIAKKNGEFLTKELFNSKGQLCHSAERKDIEGFLEDYAFLIKGFLDLYLVNFEEKYFKKSIDLIEEVFKKFYNKQTGFFFYTPDTDTLPARKTEIHDNVIPSSNSVMAENLYIAGRLLGALKYLDTAEKLIKSVSKEVKQGVPYYSNWCRLMMRYTSPPWEITITGPSSTNTSKKLWNITKPDTIITAAVEDSEIPVFQGRFEKNRDLIHICRDSRCYTPVETLEEAIKILEGEGN